MNQQYDVIVIGAGHAGCEAALAAARTGCTTLVVTGRLSHIARMPCNPSVGGPAKAQLVREVDALGGEMGRVIDRSHLHIRMLNTRKGPAVHSLRAQADRPNYSANMAEILLSQDNLDVVQELAADILLDSQGAVCGLRCESGKEYKTRALIVTTGTFLSGRIFMGDVSYNAGRSGEPPANALSQSLAKLGLEMGRLKTGTTPRLHRDSIRWGDMEEQKPSEVPLVFSDLSPLVLPEKQLSCYLTYTNSKTKSIIEANLKRSPMYQGIIEGTGPRYCPSIEDKIVRFSDRDTHQVFVEPEGFDTPEVYLQGVSTSLPLEVQQALVATIPGLEEAVFLKPGYAVEYDFVIPTQLNHSLMVEKVPGLFLAGQINGTSGYEEAAAQGIFSGINASRYVAGKERISLGRDQAYLGVLIDDLVTLGTQEPYRMHTSRCEFRLLLRQDNSDERLTPLGYEVGTVSEERWKIFEKRQDEIKSFTEKLRQKRFSDLEAKSLSEKLGENVAPGKRALDLLKRPKVDGRFFQEEGLLPDLEPRVLQQIEIRTKYEGYIDRQYQEVEKFRRMEDKKLPVALEYSKVHSLSSEAQEKLNKIRPETLGQANRVPGVSPSDIAALMVYLASSEVV